MKTGYTTQPCPACGLKKERKANVICPDCLELIERGKQFMELYNFIKTKNSNLIESQVPDNWERPYYRVHKINIASDIFELIGEKITKIAKSVSIPKPDDWGKWSYMSYLGNSFDKTWQSKGTSEISIFDKHTGLQNKFEFTHDRIFDKETHDLLKELDGLIYSAFREVERRAIDYGKNALYLLNNGEITAAQFNEI
ncbi:MAG: hypothetical protein WC222_11495 [Parachlamydiales bacterium]